MSAWQRPIDQIKILKCPLPCQPFVAMCCAKIYWPRYNVAPIVVRVPTRLSHNVFYVYVEILILLMFIVLHHCCQILLFISTLFQFHFYIFKNSFINSQTWSWEAQLDNVNKLTTLVDTSRDKTLKPTIGTTFLFSIIIITTI